MLIRKREWQDQRGLNEQDLPAYLKKNEERIPWAALLKIRNIVAFECPSKILSPLPPAPALAVTNNTQNSHNWL
jgi:hypothetical protein